MSQNFVTSCPWLLKPFAGQTSLCFRFQKLGTHSSQNFVTSCPVPPGWRSCHARFLFILIKLCWWRADGNLQLCAAVHSNVYILHAMLTIMQCFHVVSAIRCHADGEPEFRYIMALATETNPWTDKHPRSILRFEHIRKPEFRYSTACSAQHRDILNCCSDHGKSNDVKLTWRCGDSVVLVVICAVEAAIEIARVDVKAWL